MKSKAIVLERYDADEGKVFDWANLDEHTYENEDKEVVVEHLYVKTLFLAENDNIQNYIEVEIPVEEE